MGTRITQNMLNSQMLRNMNTNLTRMQNHQDQLSTGRRINKPSDDPVGISFSMRYRSELSANDQFESNVGAAVSWLEYTDTMLGQANAVIQRTRELAIRGANGTNPPQAMNAIKAEVEELYEQMVNIGNSEFNGKYVFNGQLTDKPPYSMANAQYDPIDHGEIKFEIGAGVKVAVNVPGNKVFGEPDDPLAPGTNDNIYRVMQDLISALGTSDFANVEKAIGRLDLRNDKFLEARSDVGAKLNRIELSQSRLQDISVNLQQLQSNTEDADIAEVITNLKTDENVYQSSLAVGAKLIRPSLIDFLR